MGFNYYWGKDIDIEIKINNILYGSKGHVGLRRAKNLFDVNHIARSFNIYELLIDTQES